MPRKDRKLFPGALYHVFDRGVARQKIFEDDDDRIKFLEIIEELYQAYNVVLHAYCLMGNHYHLLIETYEPNLPNFMQRFMCKYAKFFNTKYSRPGYLYQDRYDDRNVLTEKYFATLFRYFALNPIVGTPGVLPEDCKWSSYHDYFYDKQRYPFLNKTLYDRLFAKYQMNKDSISEFVNESDELVFVNFKFDDIGFGIKDQFVSAKVVSSDEREKAINLAINSLNITKQYKKWFRVYLLKKYTAYSDKYIADTVGYRGLNSLSRIYNRMKRNLQSAPRLKELVEQLEFQMDIPGMSI